MIARLKMIPTKGTNGKPNGWVLPVWNSAFDAYKPEQAYVTAIDPGCVKGPHCHFKRHGAFTVLSGTVLIVTRNGEEYQEYRSGQSAPATVHVPPGTPCALYNVGETEAMVLNMPSPPWRDNSDEHSVEDWAYEVRH